MGHDLKVHQKYYRMSDDVIDMTKVASILMAIQNGKLKEHEGQTIEQIQEEAANYEPLDNDDEEDSSDEEDVDTEDDKENDKK